MSNTTEFLRCDPFANNSFLKYSPSVYRFWEEITADGCFTCCALSTPNMNAVLFLKLSPVLFKFYGELILIITCLEKQISLYKNKRDSGFSNIQPAFLPHKEQEGHESCSSWLFWCLRKTSASNTAQILVLKALTWCSQLSKILGYCCGGRCCSSLCQLYLGSY